MNRRGFLGTLLGAGVGLALPSEVWPFRKIFLPPMWPIDNFTNVGRLDDNWLWHPEQFADDQIAVVEALELEVFRREIPQLLANETMFYNQLKRGAVVFEPNYPDRLSDRNAADAANQILVDAVREIRRFKP